MFPTGFRGNVRATSGEASAKQAAVLLTQRLQVTPHRYTDGSIGVNEVYIV
jgi:hypothetical protein